MKATVIFVLLLMCASCVETGGSAPEAGDFRPMVMTDTDVMYHRQSGQYLLVDDWVFVTLNLEFSNQDAEQASVGVRIVPPLEPAPGLVYAGTVSGQNSEFEGVTFATVELIIFDDVIEVVGHTSSTTLPGGMPLTLGLQETRAITGTIAYRTTGQFLY